MSRHLVHSNEQAERALALIELMAIRKAEERVGLSVKMNLVWQNHPLKPALFILFRQVGALQRVG